MSRRRRPLSRREVLRTGVYWSAAGLVGLTGCAAGEQEEQEEQEGRQEGAAREALEARVEEVSPANGKSSRVVLIRHREAIISGRRPDPEIVRQMLNQALARLLDSADAADAWRQLATPGDTIGVKSNVWSHLPTPRELERAIVDELLAAGVAKEEVAVDDRGVLSNPVFQRALARPTGALINVRPMRTHHWSGLGTCLKNMIMFVRRPADYHADACARLGELWVTLGLRPKTRLNILVMLTPQFHGVGPHSFSPRFVWPYRGLIVGTDPVAVDATGARIIEAKRHEYFGEERPIKPPPHHIRLADTRYGLGVSDPERIEIVRLGWREDELI